MCVGSFAPCEARPGLCPWTPRFFEKNRVKLLYVGMIFMIWCAATEWVRECTQSMLRIVAVQGPKAPQPRRNPVPYALVGRDLCVPPPVSVGILYAPCRGRCPHRPAHRTIKRCPLGYGLPVRVRPHAVMNDTRYCRDDVDIVPYEHIRTTDMIRRAGPVCPAACIGWYSVRTL